MSHESQTKRSHTITGPAAIYYEAKFRVSGLTAVHTRAASLVPLQNNDHLLDVGCGTGRLLRILHTAHPSANLLGIDASPDMIAVAREKSPPEVSFKIAYAHDLPAANGTIDVVTSVLMAHHLPPEEKDRMVGEFLRILKRGGHVLVSDFGRPIGIFGRLFWLLSRAHSYTNGNMEAIERSLVRHGFTVIKKEVQFGWIEHILAQKL